MKRSILIALTVLLVGGFVLTGTTQSVMAAEKDKYGGTLKIAISKSPRSFGYPPKIRGFDQDVVGPVAAIGVIFEFGFAGLVFAGGHHAGSGGE